MNCPKCKTKLKTRPGTTVAWKEVTCPNKKCGYMGFAFTFPAAMKKELNLKKART